MPVHGNIASKPRLAILGVAGLDGAGGENIQCPEVNDKGLADLDPLGDAAEMRFIDDDPLTNCERSLRGFLPQQPSYGTRRCSFCHFCAFRVATRSVLSVFRYSPFFVNYR